MPFTIRDFLAEDYSAARELWAASEGVGLGPGDSEVEVAASSREIRGSRK